jgi:hypothetical protein
MLQMRNKLLLPVTVILLLAGFAACNKTAIDFGSDGTAGDPNITMIDTFSVELSTLQVDSFSTSSSGHFIVGSHRDPQLGYIGAKSFFEITAPTLDLRDCTNCVFDSIDLRLKVSSGYLGDTSVPFTINLYEVTQEMDNADNPGGFNVSSFQHSTTPLVSKTFTIRPGRKDELSIRLPDEFGKNFFRMFRTNSDTVTNDVRFKNYLKGFCIETSASNNALFYFDKTTGDSAIQLHYTEAGVTPVAKLAYFTISSTDKQFNSFTYDKSGTAIAGFTPGKKQLINSSLTNNSAFLHNNSGLYPKIRFNSLYNIKELHPYVQVLKAELQVKPVSGTYGVNTFYTLPPSVEMRLTDDDNGINGSALSLVAGTETYPQDGSLYIDNLYGESTAYTYDVTSFVNTVIAEGAFSRKALLMEASSSNSAASDQRLIIGNNHSGGSVKLKLYILGL